MLVLFPSLRPDLPPETRDRRKPFRWTNPISSRYREVISQQGLHGVEPSESVRLRGSLELTMIVKRSNKAQPRHRNEQVGQDPGHRCSLLRQEERGSCLFLTAKSWPFQLVLVEQHRARGGRAARQQVEQQATLTPQGKE